MALHRSPGRARVLAGLVLDHGWERGVELGVYKGETFCHVLRACPDLTLWGVDLFDTGYYHATREGRPPKSFDLDAECARLEAWTRRHAKGRGHLLVGDTVACAPLFRDGELDFVFVDADHGYEAVHADIRAWRPKVREGGWMLGHDWNEAEFPGVVAAVREFLGEPKTYPDHVWAVPC